MAEEIEKSGDEELSSDEAALVALMEELNAAVQSGDSEKAASLQVRFWGALNAQMSQKPNPILELYGKAEQHEWAGEWAGAEETYRRALELARATNDNAHLARTHVKLADLFGLLGRTGEALEAARLAVEYAPKDNLFVRATTLPTFVALALRKGELTQAKTFLDEIATFNERQDDLRYANYLLQLAEWRFESGELDGLDADLETARKIVEPNSNVAGLAGFHNAMGKYWLLRSRLFKKAGNLKDAGAAMWEYVQCRRSVSQAPQLNGPYKFNSLAKALRAYSELCEEAGHEKDAAQARADSDEIRRLIHLPPLDD